jgi:hypothetical protein
MIDWEIHGRITRVAARPRNRTLVVAEVHVR